MEVTEAELAGLPPPLQARRVEKHEVDNDSIVHLLNPTREQRHRQRAYYLANVTMIDEKVGQILQSLEAKGYLENAVVIFTSDHGDCLTDHGQSQKETMYDIVTRVPAVIWSPGRYAGGRRIETLYQWMDLGPTILEIAGLEPPPFMEAISMLPALQAGAAMAAGPVPGAETPGRRHVFAEYGVRRDGRGFMTMVRDREWKLVHFLDEPFGQLFHLAEDPGEARNRWDDPAAAGPKRELLDAMRDWLVRSHLRTRDWTRDFR
jgi:arylsulfatase A-like enzyme